MNAEIATALPEEWRDPQVVLPHVVGELRQWLTSSREIERDLSVVLGGLDPNSDPSVPPHSVREWLTSIQARLHKLNHQVASRITVWDLVAQDLQRRAGSRE